MEPKMYIQVQQDYCFSCCLMLTFFTWKSTFVFLRSFLVSSQTWEVLSTSRGMQWIQELRFLITWWVLVAELQTYLKFWMLELSRVSVVLYKHGPIVKLEYELRFWLQKPLFEMCLKYNENPRFHLSLLHSCVTEGKMILLHKCQKQNSRFLQVPGLGPKGELKLP